MYFVFFILAFEFERLQETNINSFGILSTIFVVLLKAEVRQLS